jgi:hypothetical protein
LATPDCKQGVDSIIRQNVLFVPGLSHNLLSVSATPNRFYWTITGDKAILRNAGEPRVYNSANGKRISTKVLNSKFPAFENHGRDFSFDTAVSAVAPPPKRSWRKKYYASFDRC